MTSHALSQPTARLGASRLTPIIIGVGFFGSGAAALVYQTVWMQQFAVVFGASNVALAAVLACYMGGLCLGAFVAGRWLPRIRRPLLAYALLELGIAVCAALVQPLIQLSGNLQSWMLGAPELAAVSASGSLLWYLMAAFVILAAPTIMMGATLPILAGFVVRGDTQIGTRIGALYGLNTLGAACGTLLGAFWLLPTFGAGGAIAFAVLLNLIVALAVLSLKRFDRSADAAPLTAGPSEASDVPVRGGAVVLLLVGLSGAVAFAWEIVWTRLLAQVIGGTIYAFATMLATFLVGIAVGAMVAGFIARRRARVQSAFVLTQITCAVAWLLAFVAADAIPSLAAQSTERAAILSALTLFPGAVAAGAAFPLAVRWLTVSHASAGRVSARVYVFNTIGTIVGAIGVGYWLLPALGFAAMARAAAMVSLFAAFCASIVKPTRPRLATASLAMAMLLALTSLSEPWSILRTSALGGGQMAGEVHYHAVGRSSNVLLLDRGYGYSLTNNGLPESTVAPANGRTGSFRTAHWLAMLPAAVRPDARSMLVIGLGGAGTIELVPGSIEEIHVAELEARVVDANRSVAGLRHIDPLADPRVEVHVFDARGALRVVQRDFDAIVSQPSHPWTSGSSHLFTREFLQQVAARLSPDGVFSQWMGLPFVDEPLLRSFVATATSVFDHVAVFEPEAGSIILLASMAPIDMPRNAPVALAKHPETWRHTGAFDAVDLIAAQLLDSSGSRAVAHGARPSSDLFNLFQTRGPRILQNPLGNAGLIALVGPSDMAHAVDQDDRLAIIERVAGHSPSRARALARGIDGSIDQPLARAIVNMRGNRDRAEFALREAASLCGERCPRRQKIMDLLLSLYVEQIENGGGLALIERIDDPASLALIRGWQLRGAGLAHAIAELDGALAAMDSSRSLFAEAVRLRVLWRLDDGAPARLEEAIAMVDPLTARTRDGSDRLLLASAEQGLGRTSRALGAIERAAGQLTDAEIAAAIDWIVAMPADPATAPQRNRVLSRLHRQRNALETRAMRWISR